MEEELKKAEEPKIGKICTFFFIFNLLNVEMRNTENNISLFVISVVKPVLCMRCCVVWYEISNPN